MNLDPEITHALGPPAANQDTRTFDPALEAGLAAAFGPEPTRGGWSLPPVLRDDSAEDLLLVQPSSSEMPRFPGERYQLLGEIARGGMGVILKGRDPDLGRDLAFKVLKAELCGRPVAEQRFVEEAQVGGQLQHPGIVPVYELGRFADGRPYFTMKLVRGRTLAALLADRLSPDHDRGRFLKVFEQVAQTIAYAHSKGVIHRDLKPSNVMVGAFGEVQVMDWGLAKVLQDGGLADEERAKLANRTAVARGTDDEPSAIQTARSGPGSGSETAAGSVLGTPSFMPPEQAGGETDKLDERADVFGLGAVLCVILTGQPPHTGDEPEEVRLKAIRGELGSAFARLDGCGADAELVTLCKRCLAPEREARPRHAGEVAAAITSYLQSVEDRAHRAEVERAEAEVRAGEQRKRRRVQAALGVTLTLGVGLLGFGMWWQERQSATAIAERMARQSRTAAGVAAALDEARARSEEAWGLADEPDKMRVACDLARSAFHRAEGFASAGEPTPEVEDHLTTVRASVAELDRHTSLFVSADLALRVHDIGPDGSPDGAKTTFRLAEAFQKVGWSPVKTPALTIVKEIAADRARNKVLGFLCDWEFQSSADAAARQQVRAVIRQTRLEAGGTLARWQGVMDDGDAAALVELATGTEVLALGPELLCALGRDLGMMGHRETRLALLRRAVDRYPTHVWINYDLSRACRSVNPPQEAEALRYASVAATARPDSALLQVNLGECLLALKANRHAAAVYRKAISLAPSSGAAHGGLAAALNRIGDRAQTIAAYRDLVGLAPKSARARAELGKVLHGIGDLNGAIAESQEAIQLDPNQLTAHYTLALAYQKQGAFEEAAASFRTLARLVPSGAPAYKRGATSAERLHGFAKRLPAIKRGEDKPTSPTDAVQLAVVCCTFRQKEYALAVRMYTEAFAADPQLTGLNGHNRYNAACAAARVAAGDDAEALVGAKEASRLRNQAREWLAADLVVLRVQARSAQALTRRAAIDRLAQWLTDPDLQSVREPALRAALSEDERKAWEELWADVEVILKGG